MASSGTNIKKGRGKTHNNGKQASSKISQGEKESAVKEKARDEKNASFSDRNITEYKVYANSMAKFEFCNKFKIPNLEKDCGVSVQKKLPRTWIVTGTKENIEHFGKQVKSIMDSLISVPKVVEENIAKTLRPEHIESRHPCTLKICMKRRMPGNKLKGWRHENGQFVCLAGADPTDTEYIKVTIQTSNVSDSKCLNPSSEFCLCVPHWKDGKSKETSIVCENVHALMSKAGDKVLSIPLNIVSKTGWREIKFMKIIIDEFNNCEEQTSIVFVHPLPDVCEKLVQELNLAFLGSQEIKQEESSSGIDVMKKKLKISVVKGLLTEQKSDIIVNSTNNKLDFTSGFTAKSILKAAGVEIKRECYQRYPMGIPYDSIAETSGYKLCKTVLHCIMLDYEFPYSTRMKHLKSVVTKCLIKANFMKVKSIAFPAFGTGKLKYPCQDVAEVMFEATEKFASSLHPSDTSLEDVKFVIYGEDSKTIKAFEAVEKRLKTQKLSELGEQSSITTKVENLELVVTRSDSLLIPTDALVIIWKSTQLSGNQKISEKREYLWSLDKKAQIDIATIKNKLQTDRNSVAITSADGLKSQKHLLHVQLSFTSIEDIRKLLRSVFQKSDEEKYSAVTVIIDSKEFNSRAAGEFGQAIPEVIKEFLSKTPNYSLSLVQCFIKDKKSCESFLENLYTLDWTTWSPQESKGNAASLKSDDQSFKDQHMVLITGHKDNVGKCIDELFSGAIPKKMNSKEPPKQSISRDERFGNPATGDIRKPQEAIKMDSGREMDKTYTRLSRTDKEKCCVILKIKDKTLMAKDEKYRKAYLWKHVQPAPELIVHPFNSSEKALLKYSTGHDAEKVVNQEMAEFELSEFPVQALNNLRATLSSKMMGIIEDVESLKQTIKENSGADVLSKDHQIYLEGNILEMEVAYKYLRQFVKEYKEKYENERSSPSTDMSKHAADSCRSLADGSQSGCSEHKYADQGSQLPFKDSVTCAVNTNPGTNSLSVPDEETSAISDGVRSSIKDPRVVKDRTNIVTENSCSSPTHSNTIATELKSNQSGNGKDTEMRNPSLRESKPEDQMTGRESKINPSTNVHRYNVSVPAEQYEVMKQLNLMSFLQRDIQKRDSKVVILMDDEQYNKYLNAEEKFHSLYNCTFDINPRVERGTIAPIKSNYAGQVFIGDEHFPKVKMYGINRNVVDQVISDFKSTSSYRASDYQQSRNRKQKRKN